jgi:hypothetical protein
MGTRLEQIRATLIDVLGEQRDGFGGLGDNQPPIAGRGRLL